LQVLVVEEDVIVVEEQELNRYSKIMSLQQR
jgi:hypothetical protein